MWRWSSSLVILTGGGNSLGAARAVGDHDGLGVGAVGPGDQELLRAVFAYLMAGDAAGQEAQTRRQGFAVPLGEIGHLPSIEHGLVVDPIAQLIGPESGPAPLRR